MISVARVSLGVMATRLARIVDRARDLELRWAALDEHVRAAARVENTIILMYTGWSYWVFRGKVRGDLAYH